MIKHKNSQSKAEIVGEITKNVGITKTFSSIFCQLQCIFVFL